MAVVVVVESCIIGGRVISDIPCMTIKLSSIVRGENTTSEFIRCDVKL